MAKPLPEKLIIVHKGALGDFLQTWPCIYTLSKYWKKGSVFWAGRESYLPWVNPLNIDKAEPKMKKSVQEIYSSQEWPKDLNDVLVIWFGLLKGPFNRDFDQLWFIQGIEKKRYVPPRQIYCERLAQKGFFLGDNWLSAWRQLSEGGEKRFFSAKNNVLIFPGSGHKAKCWPLQNFLILAKYLQSKGYDVVFVLGPAEEYRNIEVKNFEHIICRDYRRLQELLLRAKLVIGNDCGPMHLAGYMGVPCLSIFGPTSPQQWGPLGAKIIYQNLSCSPCTQIGQIQCQRLTCLKEITPEQVCQESEMLLCSLKPSIV